ncbi:class I SAM-dependent methyltransferase [Acidovorax sp. M2(2025)]|uniref:class I SAM-dependent methyltransferase n=1 Tax=Acidovorax sp. M2(2025) TaxID=3411355 RepID=UPI003BF5AEF0
MKISEGLREGGIVVGNNYNKYSTQNPIARRLMRGFSESLSALVSKAAPETIHEVGCGEGYWTLAWHQQGMQVKGSDFSEQVIALAQENAAERGLPPTLFSRRSIYELAQGDDSADLIVCCEVLEHLDDPEAGLAALRRVATRNIILSVPREPLWCALNLARGKYWSSLGNTPGHIQHWSSRAFVDLVQKYFEVQEIRKPLPWTMLLCKKY